MIGPCTASLGSDPERERFAQLYRAHHQRLLRLAAQLLGPGPKAEDAVHDGFAKLAQHLPQLWDRSEEQLSAWLAVVVKNTALDMLRRERRETALEDGCWEPSTPADGGEFHALVALIRGMPEEYRRVLELRFVTEWSIAEIAAALEIPASTVKTRIFRGRRLLMERLRKEGYLDGRTCV